jgi:hypothetical protein
MRRSSRHPGRLGALALAAALVPSAVSLGAGPPAHRAATQPPPRTAVVELVYQGSLSYRRDTTGLAENGGGCGLSSDNQHAPVADHAAATLGFRSVWRLSVPLREPVTDRSLLGRASTRGSRYAFNGVFYDDGCQRHIYPVHGHDCRGALGTSDRPWLNTFAQPGGRLGLAADPVPAVAASPSSCRVSPSSFTPTPSDRTVDEEVLDGLPDATEQVSLRPSDLVHHTLITRKIPLARRAPDSCPAIEDQIHCRQTVTGQASLTVRRLRLVR